MLSAVAGAWAYVIGKKGRVLEKTALTLVLAGGASNLYDRLKRGYVVDYFSIQWKKLKKVVFNLGDIFIFAGSALFAAVQLVEEVREILPKEKIFVKEEGVIQAAGHKIQLTHAAKYIGAEKPGQ